MINLSTHLATTLAAAIKTKLDGGFLHVFYGPVPETADDATTASNGLLYTVSESGGGVTGLTFVTPTTGLLSKTVGETWSGTAGASGNASFYRFCAAGDDGTAASSGNARIQGIVGTDPFTADLIVPSVTVVNGTLYPIDMFVYNVPLA